MEYHDNTSKMSTSDLLEEREFRIKQLNYWKDYKETLCNGDDALLVASREINWYINRLHKIKKELQSRGDMSIGNVAPQETPESGEIEAQGYDDESCPYCRGVVVADDLYDDEIMFTRFTCQDCGYRWNDDEYDDQYS